MAVTFDQDADPVLIRLEGEVDISQADELKRVLLEALEAKREVRIAMEGATCMDITAAQLLWAAGRAAGSAGMVLASQGTVPEPLRASMREAGFDRFPLADASELSSEVQ